ncbi:MAG TPA: hypothetical protein PLZ51_20525 [Aggregatilineales bacterium]|nr:hypothetical protein [Aggregatilineales bacterium]
MNRNLKSELLTAIFVLGGIALAIGAIFILSLSTPTEISAIATATTASMVVESPVDENPTPTALNVTAQSAINTNTPNPIATPTLSNLQSSALATLTAFASIPTRTATTSPTPTNTFIVPTATARVTNTPVPPKNTDTPLPPTPTNTAIPAIVTNTSVPATATSRPTNTTIPTASPSNTPIPATSTTRPTNTPILLPTNTPIVANNTVTPVANDTPTPPILLNVEGCLNPSIQIASPQPNEGLTEKFEVIGTATLPNFGFYRIEIRADSALIYQRITAVQQVVYADVLAEIDPTEYPSGIYWIRLVVVDNRGNIAENGTCAIPTIFE